MLEAANTSAAMTTTAPTAIATMSQMKTATRTTRAAEASRQAPD